MQQNLTDGNVTKSMLLFSLPIILGNLMQQLYQIADTFIVGQYLGPQALAAVGASFTLMIFLTSIVLGLCMGSGVVFSMLYGAGDIKKLQISFFVSFVFIGILALLLTVLSLFFIQPILQLLHIPTSIKPLTKEYLEVIFCGIFFTFLYNYFTSLLRSIGNSFVPLLFLSISVFLNIGLDLLFVLSFKWGIGGAAFATILSQGISAISIAIYALCKYPNMRPKKQHFIFDKGIVKEIGQYSLLTCIQQSVMNFGILMIQGLINQFGVSVMAAFAVAVKIDSFAYMPVQDFGNAFSTFIAQNHGANKPKRIQQGIKSAAFVTVLFCLFISCIVFVFAKQLLLLFINPTESYILSVGVQYLRIEGACYLGVGFLFLFYGYFRGVGKPGISVILTILSLGTRVALAYLLSPIPSIGLLGIWWAIPIGWFLADMVGLFFLSRKLNFENF